MAAMAMPILAPRERGPEGGVKEDAMAEEDANGDEALTRVVEEKTSPSMPMREPGPGFCWQLTLRVVMTSLGAGLLAGNWGWIGKGRGRVGEVSE